jgi:hypothetical protein
MNCEMKATGLILSAVAGFALAACGYGAKAAFHFASTPPTTQRGSTLTFIAPTTVTLPSAQTGTAVRCTNHGVAADAKVPARRRGAATVADGLHSSATLNLTRDKGGLLTVSCTL